MTNLVVVVDGVIVALASMLFLIRMFIVTISISSISSISISSSSSSSGSSSSSSSSSSSIFIAGTLILGVMNGHGNPSPTSLWQQSGYHYSLSLSLCRIKGQPLSRMFLWSMANIMMWPVVIHQPSFRRTPVNIATQSGFWLFRWVTSLRTGSPWWEPLSHCDCQWLVTMMSVRSPSHFHMYVHPCVCVHMIEHVACLHIIIVTVIVQQSRLHTIWLYNTIDITIDWLTDCLHPITRLVLR